MTGWENREPQKVFQFFQELCAIPHGSGNTEKISNYFVQFAKDRGLFWKRDDLGNVVIKKEAAAGYEQAPGVVLQGHMDMVCEKKPGSQHDFTKDGLKLELLEGRYLSAKDTTLGGDDGIALAYGLALLDGDYPHPALELLATVDEEIGLLGAAGLDASMVDGRRFINLDSEEEGVLLVSCAGGAAAVSRIPITYEEREGVRVEVKISGLLGGHSGAEIHKIRGNANLLMGRALYSLSKQAAFSIASLKGGEKDNAIPRECSAVLLLAPGAEEAVKPWAKALEADLKKEYQNSDEGVACSAVVGGRERMSVLTIPSREKVLFYLMNLPNGVQKMSGSISGLVETSMNLGILSLEAEELHAISGLRSSVEAARNALADKVEYLTEFLGGEFALKGIYPPWEYQPKSPLRETMLKIYEECFGKPMAVKAIHAGLECGIFCEKLPGLDCVSLGPDILDIHTTEERMDLDSVARVWEYLLRVLKALR